ncbi:MAG: PadR family transcriptional regulator [Desulfurococcales archaeon]|nr:PadR family transcriptional regulator [Desulfurococcales archaeon]
MLSNTVPRRLLKGITVGSLWMYVLAVLARRPSYPYEARKMIREEFGFEPPIVTLYTTFYRLEREGLIKKVEGHYMVSEKGWEVLTDAIRLLRDLANKFEKLATKD